MGKPYLLFRVRDYTYKITTAHPEPKRVQNTKKIKHEMAICLKMNISCVPARFVDFPFDQITNRAQNCS